MGGGSGGRWTALPAVALAAKVGEMVQTNATSMVARTDDNRICSMTTQPASIPHALDVFHHEGAFGIEPQAYFVGTDATQLAMRVRELAARR